MRAPVLLLVLAILASRLPVRAETRFGPVLRTQDGLELRWSGGAGPFQLEGAPSAAGPWEPVGPAGPATNAVVPTAGAGRYFRVRDTGGDTGTDPSEAALRVTLDAVGTFVDSVPRDPRAAWRTAVLGFLRGRADINAAGESPDGVWAITEDGIPLAIWNNRRSDPPGQDDAEGLAALAGTETPGGSRARFATTVGQGFTLAAPRLSRQLAGNGYVPVSDDAPLDSLKGTRPESVFFFNTHGGTFQTPLYGADGRPLRDAGGFIAYEDTFGLWTGTRIDPRSTTPLYNHAEFVSELKAKRLCLAFAKASERATSGGGTTDVNEWRFGITANWVRHYLRFPAENHASVWLAACRSGSAGAAPMRAAFRAVGAEFVQGWTGYVDGDGILSATSFVWDRLLGANRFFAPATPQRPFGYEEVWAELRTRGLHRHPTVDDNDNPATTDIVYEGDAGDGAFGLFAPSLSHVLVDEVGDRLHLIGLFGNPPEADRQVLIAGETVGIDSWEPRKIVVKLPRTGAGSAGDVQVVVRGHRSNVRRLTRWTLTGTYQMRGDEEPHRIDGTLTVIFRADVGEYRQVPGNVFIRPTRNAPASRASEVHLEAKGIVSSSCGDGRDETEEWKGSGMFPTYDPGGPQIATVYLRIDTITGTGALALVFGMRDFTSFPLKTVLTLCEGQRFEFPLAPPSPGDIDQELTFGSPLDERLPDGSALEVILPGAPIAVGPDWAIPAGEMSNELMATWKWNRAEAEFPPDPQAAR